MHADNPHNAWLNGHDLQYVKACGTCVAQAAGLKDNKTVSLYAHYLVELTLPNYSMLRYPSSMIAASAVYLANWALRDEAELPYALQKHSGFSQATMRPCVVALIELHKKAPSASLVAVYKKYGSEKYGSISKLPTPVSILSQMSVEA